MLKIHPLTVHAVATIIFWIAALVTGAWWLLVVWFLGSMLAWWLFMVVSNRMDDHRKEQERQKWESLVKRLTEV